MNELPSKFSGARWRLIQGIGPTQLLTVADGPPVEHGSPVEVMPVSEHETVVDYDSASFKEGFQMGSAEEWMVANDLRSAAKAVLDAGLVKEHPTLDRLREALDNNDTEILQ